MLNFIKPALYLFFYNCIVTITVITTMYNMGSSSSILNRRRYISYNCMCCLYQACIAMLSSTFHDCTTTTTTTTIISSSTITGEYTLHSAVRCLLNTTPQHCCTNTGNLIRVFGRYTTNVTTTSYIATHSSSLTVPLVPLYLPTIQNRLHKLHDLSLHMHPRRLRHGAPLHWHGELHIDMIRWLYISSIDIQTFFLCMLI